MKNKLLGGLTAVALCACGGGGGGSAGSGGSSSSSVSTYTPSAAVVAAKQTNYATTFAGVNPLAPGVSGTCEGSDISTTVYVLPNTVTYAAKGVSELSQQQVAEYSEKALAEIKAALGLPSGTGFTGQPVQICTQKGLLAFGAAGLGTMTGFTVTSSDSPGFNSAYLTNDFDLYKRTMKHELVHTYHNSALGTDGGVLDTWFAEGLAEYIARGKSDRPKTEILNLVNTQNPIDVMSAGLVNYYPYYPAFQSSVAYLFEPTGANNPIQMIPAFLAAVKTNWTNAGTACFAANTCATFKETAFAQTFDANFKESDGSAMALRTGANNLESTIATRLTSFLQ